MPKRKGRGALSPEQYRNNARFSEILAQAKLYRRAKLLHSRSKILFGAALFIFVGLAIAGIVSAIVLSTGSDSSSPSPSPSPSPGPGPTPTPTPGPSPTPEEGETRILGLKLWSFFLILGGSLLLLIAAGAGYVKYNKLLEQKDVIESIRNELHKKTEELQGIVRQRETYRQQLENSARQTAAIQAELIQKEQELADLSAIRIPQAQGPAPEVLEARQEVQELRQRLAQSSGAEEKLEAILSTLDSDTRDLALEYESTKREQERLKAIVRQVGQVAVNTAGMTPEGLDDRVDREAKELGRLSREVAEAEARLAQATSAADRKALKRELLRAENARDQAELNFNDWALAREQNPAWKQRQQQQRLDFFADNRGRMEASLTRYQEYLGRVQATEVAPAITNNPIRQLVQNPEVSRTGRLPPGISGEDLGRATAVMKDASTEELEALAAIIPERGFKSNDPKRDAFVDSLYAYLKARYQERGPAKKGFTEKQVERAEESKRKAEEKARKVEEFTREQAEKGREALAGVTETLGKSKGEGLRYRDVAKVTALVEIKKAAKKRKAEISKAKGEEIVRSLKFLYGYELLAVLGFADKIDDPKVAEKVREAVFDRLEPRNAPGGYGFEGPDLVDDRPAEGTVSFENRKEAFGAPRRPNPFGRGPPKRRGPVGLLAGIRSKGKKKSEEEQEKEEGATARPKAGFLAELKSATKKKKSAKAKKVKAMGPTENSMADLRKQLQAKLAMRTPDGEEGAAEAEP